LAVQQGIIGRQAADLIAGKTDELRCRPEPAYDSIDSGEWGFVRPTRYAGATISITDEVVTGAVTGGKRRDG
jgi:hypothetical protein